MDIQDIGKNMTLQQKNLTEFSSATVASFNYSSLFTNDSALYEQWANWVLRSQETSANQMELTNGSFRGMQ